jgi:hypothetical protein
MEEIEWEKLVESDELVEGEDAIRIRPWSYYCSDTILTKMISQ